MGEVVEWGSFSGVFFAQRTADPELLYIYHRGFDQGCAFGGSQRYISSHGELPPKTPHFRDVNGDFQLKCLQAYLGTEEIDHNT
jgi:hypothetical protein